MLPPAPVIKTTSIDEDLFGMAVVGGHWGTMCCVRILIHQG